MAIGGLSAANGVAKITGEGWFTIFQQTSQLANMMTKGRGTPVGARGYELATEEDGNYSFGFPQEGGNLPPGNSSQTIRPAVCGCGAAACCAKACWSALARSVITSPLGFGLYSSSVTLY